jgi:hypothetical protein
MRPLCKLVILVLAFTISFPSLVGAIELTQPQPVRPRFSTSTVTDLRNTMKGIRPMRLSPGATAPVLEPMPFAPVVGKMVTTTAPATGTVASPYASAQGLVLSVLRPEDTTTKTQMVVLGVFYSPQMRMMLAANDPQAYAACLLTWKYSGGNILAATDFKGLPVGKHTYVLSVGTDVPKENLEIWEGNTRPLLTGAQLVFNPLTMESRGLLVLDQRVLGIAIKANQPKTGLDSNGNAAYYFHHIQLTCLDCQ